MSEIIRFAIGCAVPICIMGFAAFLIWKQVDGWGWYLFVAVLIVGSMKISVQ